MQKQKPKKLPLFVVVGPFGQVQHVRPLENSGGDNVVIYDPVEKECRIPKRYREQGWIPYEDLCAGRYKPMFDETPVTAPDKWAVMQRVTETIEKGLRLPKMPADFYHPEVMSRRENSKFGKHIANEDVFSVPEKAAPVKSETKDEAPKRKRRGPSA